MYTGTYSIQEKRIYTVPVHCTLYSTAYIAGGRHAVCNALPTRALVWRVSTRGAHGYSPLSGYTIPCNVLKTHRHTRWYSIDVHPNDMRH